MQAHQRRNLTNKSQENSWDLLLGMVKTIPKFFNQIFLISCTLYDI